MEDVKYLDGLNSLDYKKIKQYIGTVYGKKNVGSPASGELADLRKFSRSIYHWTTEQAKRNATEILQERTAFTLTVEINFLRIFGTPLRK